MAIAIAIKQVKLLQTQIKAIKKDKNELLYQTAKKCVGLKLRTIGRKLACANSFNNLALKATGKPIGGGDSTIRMRVALLKKFESIDEPRAKCIIIATTGTNVIPTWKSKIYNGHVGYLGEGGIIYSNNSKTGLWDNHWTLDKFIKYYCDRGGYEIEFFTYPQGRVNNL